MQIDWSKIIAFIAERDASLASSFVGLTQAEIDAVQVQYGIVLPSAYVDFLITMGEDSGGLYPFGDTYIHAFSALLEQLPPEGYPSARFFKVAFRAEEFAIDPIDIYLDLTRADGNDAPLVEFEQPFDPAATALSQDYLSFGERLVYVISWKLDVGRRKYGADIVVFGGDSGDGIAMKQAALEVLTRSGFSAALPDLRRVGCVTRDSGSVLLSVSEAANLVEFEIGGDSREAVEEPVRELLAAFPAAKLSEAVAERVHES